MNNNSFDRAMNQIVGQAEAEKQQEIKNQQRAVILGRVRSVFVFLLIATVAVFAFCYRDQIQGMIFAKKPAAPGGAQTAAALSAAQQNANTRDSVIADITK